MSVCSRIQANNASGTFDGEQDVYDSIAKRDVRPPCVFGCQLRWEGILTFDQGVIVEVSYIVTGLIILVTYNNMGVRNMMGMWWMNLQEPITVSIWYGLCDVNIVN